MATKRTFLVPLFVLVVLAFGSARAHAQGLGFGVKGGPVFPDFSTDVFNVDNRTGFNAGIFFGGNRPGVFGVQAEVNWLRVRTFLTDATTGNTARIRLDYVQVPVLARINLGTRSKNGIAIYAIAGPSFDGKVGERVEIPGVTSIPSDNFDSFNISLMFGGGVEITRIIIEARYSKGLKQIDKNFSSVADLHLNHFAVLFGLRFN